MAAKTPAVNSLHIYRGTAPVLSFTVDDDPTDPASGWATAYSLRMKPTDADLALQATGAWNAETGTIDVAITREQTLALSPGAHAGSFFRTDSGLEEILSRDNVTVSEGIYDPPGS